MRLPTRSGRWFVGVLMVMQMLGFTAAAAAEERLRAGMKELALAGGYSTSHNPTSTPGLERVEGFHLIPHLGYVLTDERGAGWLRGNFELLAEPTLIYLDASESATVGGLAALGRWMFTTPGPVRPYLEAGVGILAGELAIRQTNCDVNFILQTGAGVMVLLSETTALTAGYRFHHVSNADRCDRNLGLNSSLFVLGLSYFFP